MRFGDIQANETYCVDLPRDQALRYGQFRAKAVVVAKGLPYGKTRLGVLVEFSHQVPRQLSPSIGAGWETDPVTGEMVYDQRPASVVCHPARIVKQWDEYELGVAIARYEHQQRGSAGQRDRPHEGDRTRRCHQPHEPAPHQLGDPS